LGKGSPPQQRQQCLTEVVDVALDTL